LNYPGRLAVATAVQKTLRGACGVIKIKVDLLSYLRLKNQ